ARVYLDAAMAITHRAHGRPGQTNRRLRQHDDHSERSHADENRTKPCRLWLDWAAKAMWTGRISFGVLGLGLVLPACAAPKRAPGPPSAPNVAPSAAVHVTPASSVSVS